MKEWEGKEWSWNREVKDRIKDTVVQRTKVYFHGK
jgi:hypothetical protein